MADWSVKRGNTAFAFATTITDANGSVVDLTGATVKFVARQLTATGPSINAAAAIVSPSSGTVSYTPTAADVNTAGQYMCEWQYTLSGGATGTYPVDGYQELTIEEDLSAASAARLVSLGEVKDHLRIPASDRTHDARLVQMIGSLTPVIEFITGPILQRIYQNETYDGGYSYISLMHRPVIEVHEVTEYRGPIPYRLQQIPTPDLGTIYSYMFEPPGRIVRRTVGGGITPFPPGFDQVSVTYTAGFVTVPSNVREAALELVRVNYQQTEQGGRPGFGSGGEADSLISHQAMGFYVPGRVHELLSPNRRHVSVA